MMKFANLIRSEQDVLNETNKSYHCIVAENNIISRNNFLLG